MNEITPNSAKLYPREEWIIISEGKTKRINGNVGVEHAVVMKNKSDITAGDGEKHDIIEGKAEASTTITVNVFKALEMMGVETHFQEQISDTEILVDDCGMIQAECVFRHVATGSYHKRDKYLNGENALPDGTILDEPIMEFFYKQDVILGDGTKVSDPLMDIDEKGIPKIENGRFVLLHPATGEPLEYKTVVNPSTKQPLGFEGIQKDIDVILESATDMRSKTLEIGEKLQKFYGSAGLGVWDGKIEYGKRKKDGKMVAADVIDGDSIRLRDALVVLGTRQLHIGNNVDRDAIIKALDNKYFSGLVRALERNDTVLVQSILGQIEDKFINSKTPLPKNDDGSYVTDKKLIEKILGALDFISREQLKPIGDYVVKRIIEAEGLDKQGYRDGESTEETLSKYEKLAKITDKLLEGLESIDDVVGVMNARAIDVLGRPN